MRGHGALIAAVVAAGMAMTAPAAAAPARPADAGADVPPNPPYTTDSFAFAGPDLRDVRLTENQGRTGTIVVRLRNRTRLTGHVRLRYFPYAGGTAQELTANGKAVAAPRANAKALAVRVVDGADTPLAGREYALLRLQFTLPKGRPLQDIDGIVVAQLQARGPYGPVARLRVRGAAPRVTFDPDDVSFTIDRYAFMDVGETQEVVVRGPDAAVLAAGKRPIATQVLGSGSSQVRVAIGVPVLDVEDGVYVSKVTVSDVRHLDTGEFAGDVPLTDGRNGPGLKVKATIGFSFLIMALVIFLGALVAGRARLYTAASRDARVLRMKLLQAVHDYDTLVAQDPEGRIFSHRLDGWLEPRPPDGHARSYPGSRGVAGLEWHLRTARTRRDVDEVRYRVRETILHVERFLTLEPVARTAYALLRERPPVRGDALSLRDCWVYRDTIRLLDDARIAPDPSRAPVTDEEGWKTRVEAEDDAAGRLVAALASRAAMLELALDAWTYLAAFDAIRDGFDDAAWARIAGCEIATLKPRRARPSDDGNEELRFQDLRIELRTRLMELEELWPKDRPRPTRTPAEPELPALSAASLSRICLNPSAGIGTTEAQAPAKEKWDWGTIVQVDWAWTLVTGLILSVTYTVGAEVVTDGTWGGSVLDYASAFVVGAAGEAVPWSQLAAWRGKDGTADDLTGAKPAAAEQPAPAPAPASANGGPPAGEPAEAPVPDAPALVGRD